jgi:hypothetical protein
MICPAPPDEDFNVFLLVIVVVIAMLFGLARNETGKTAEKPEAVESGR